MKKTSHPQFYTFQAKKTLLVNLSVVSLYKDATYPCAYPHCLVFQCALIGWYILLCRLILKCPHAALIIILTMRLNY